MIAAALLASAVFLLTVASWPGPRARPLPRFVEDPSVPRTLH